MRIYILGQVALEEEGAVVHERDLPGNQARVALAMLAVEHRHPVNRERLAEAIWPGQLPASWETALRAVVSKVRTALSGAGLPPNVIRNGFGCYHLPLNGGWLDLDAAADALHSSEADLARGAGMTAAANAIVTSMICSRPFLPGADSPWTLNQRVRIASMHASARRCLAEAYAQTGDYLQSARAAEIALSLDPYSETTYQRLIRSHALAGDRIGAARVFRRYSAMVESELGIAPTAETVAVFHEAIST